MLTWREQQLSWSTEPVVIHQDQELVDYIQSNCIQSAIVHGDQFFSQYITKVEHGPVAVLFSGGWRFNFNAVYLEHKIYKNTTLTNHEHTYFIDLDNKSLLNALLKKINAANTLILHSSMFDYRSLTDIITQLPKYQPPGGQILYSVPHCRVNFNRLKYSVEDMAKKVQAQVVDDCFVIQKIIS
jgi:hypothetical protein